MHIYGRIANVDRKTWQIYFQISDVTEGDSGAYSCHLVGEALEGRREKKNRKEETREEVEINVFRKEKENEEDNWKVFFEEKKQDFEESERGGSENSSRVIFQKFQNTSLLNGRFGDNQNEMESGTKSTGNHSELLISAGITEVQQLSRAEEDLISRPTTSKGSSSRPTAARPSSRPKLLLTKAASGKTRSCRLLVFLCYLCKMSTNSVFWKYWQ